MKKDGSIELRRSGALFANRPHAAIISERELAWAAAPLIFRHFHYANFTMLEKKAFTEWDVERLKNITE